MNTGLLFRASAIAEVLTGLALLVAPLFVIGLLLGDLPADREPPTDVGLDELDALPEGFFAQWLSPFRWERIEARSRLIRR